MEKAARRINSGGLTLRSLEVFLCVAEEDSMSAAAQKLGLTQAAVSQAITALEGALGTRLFDRTIRPLALTLVGGTVLKYAAAISDKVHEIEEAARYGGSGKVALLRIGMLNSFATTAGAFVLDQLHELAEEWTVVSGFKATTIQSLVDRMSDVIITSDESPIPPELRCLPLFSEPFVVAVPAAYRGKITSLEILAEKLDFIRYGHDVHMSKTVNGYLKMMRADSAKRYQFDTTDAALHMVAGGYGWTMVTPLILLKSVSQLDAIRIVPLRDRKIRRKIIVAMRKGDGLAIAERVRDAGLSALKEIIIPKLNRLLPLFARQVKIESKKQRRQQCKEQSDF